MRCSKYQTGDLRRLFVSCSFYLVLNTVLILVISALFLSRRPFAAGVGFLTMGSITAFVYIGDRLHITEEDRINNPDRTALVEKYYTELVGTAAVSLLLFELSVFVPTVTTESAGAMTVLLAHVPVAVLAGYDRIKAVRIPLDSVSVAFAWAYQIVFVFAVLTPSTITRFEGIVLFGCWFLIVIAGLEMRNVKDIAGDREAGKLTFACLLGAQSTKRLCTVMKATGTIVLAGVSGSMSVLGLVVVHLLLLRFYGTLETDFRAQSSPSSTGVGS